MPEVSIFAAYSAGAMIATRATVPEVVPANKIKALAGHEKTANVFARLAPHPLDKQCACFACDPPRPSPKFAKDWYWTLRGAQRRYVRYDIGARNVRLKARDGDFYVVVADCDVDEWLLELSGRDRLGLMLALPITLERVTKRKEGAKPDD